MADCKKCGLYDIEYGCESPAYKIWHCCPFEHDLQSMDEYSKSIKIENENDNIKKC